MRVKAWAVVERGKAIAREPWFSRLPIYSSRNKARLQFAPGEFEKGEHEIIHVEIRTLPARKSKRKVRTT